MPAGVVLAAISVGSIVLLAEATTDPSVAQYLNYGMAGLWLLAIATGQFRTKAEVEGLKADKVELQKQVNELLAMQRDQSLPAITTSANAIRGSATQVAGLATSIAHLDEAVQELLRRQGG